MLFPIDLGFCLVEKIIPYAVNMLQRFPLGEASQRQAGENWNLFWSCI